jgi:hypothetical protein
MAGREMSKAGARQSFLLWVGIILPATAWMVQLFVLYMLEEFISCTPGSQTPGAILGFGVRSIALFLTVVLAAATAAAGLVSLRIWRGMTPESDEGTAAERARWMAVAGMMSSALFLVIILLKVAPPLLIGVCEAPL